MDMDFYKFEIDDDRFGSNYGYSISNPLQFQNAPDDLVIYMDRDTNEWIAQSGTGNDFGSEDDLDLLMSDISTTYGADGYKVEQDDDYDLSSEASDIQVASFRIRDYSYRSAMMDMLRYGIDIDVDSGTVAGKRASVSKWKRARMKAAAIPGWKMLDFDLYEFQNGKEDTFVSVANDGKWHLYSNGLDMAAFEDAETAMENADTILEAQTPDYEAPWWQIGVDTSGDEIKTAGVWKLDLDRPLTPSKKKTFLDNNVDVNEFEQDDGTNVLTMTGSDKVAADTAELPGLTDDFVQDAYTPDVDDSLNDEAPDEDVDISDDMPDEIQQEIDESDMEEPSDPQKQEVIDGIIDLLEDWKDDSMKASRVAGQHTCPICLLTVDDDDMEHCDMADMDMCPDCCKLMCEGEEDKSDKIAACTTDDAFPWGVEDGGWYYSYYVGEPGNCDNSYLFTLQEEDDGWSFEVRDLMSAKALYQSEVYPDRETCEDAASDFEYEHCQTVYDYEVDDDCEDEDGYEFWLRQHGIDNDEDSRLASVKKAHSSDIQMMLGDTGYYWHLEVMDDAGHIIKEGDYATEELASEAANSMIGKETDVPVADVDGTVFDQPGYIMDDTSGYDDWGDAYDDECLEDDFESYAEDGCPTIDDIVNDDDDEDYLEEANRKGKSITASTITAYNASDFDESNTYEYGGQKYRIYDTKSSDPLLPGYKILQISEIHPYDDADYAWAIYDAADNPNYACIVRNGKTEDRIAISPWADNEEYYEEYYDADSALDQYRNEVIIQLAYALRESNEDVKPRTIHD